MHDDNHGALAAGRYVQVQQFLDFVSTNDDERETLAREPSRGKPLQLDRIRTYLESINHFLAQQLADHSRTVNPGDAHEIAGLVGLKLQATETEEALVRWLAADRIQLVNLSLNGSHEHQVKSVEAWHRLVAEQAAGQAIKRFLATPNDRHQVLRAWQTRSQYLAAAEQRCWYFYRVHYQAELNRLTMANQYALKAHQKVSHGLRFPSRLADPSTYTADLREASIAASQQLADAIWSARY